MMIKLACAGVVCVLLAAGLSPFRSPKNHVSWIPKQNGLHFERYSSILSAGEFHKSNGDNGTSESIEVRLEPESVNASHTILAFDDSDHPGPGFSLRQYKNALVVRQPYIDQQNKPDFRWLAVANAFHKGQRVLVTVTMSGDRVQIYLDGVLKETFASRGSSANNLTGRLVVANASRDNDSWQGQVLGLGMYNRPLTAERVEEHRSSWQANGGPRGSGDGVFALYLFNEHQGNVAHNQLDTATDLTIPPRYFILHPRFVASVAHDYQPTVEYWEDVAVNVLGFVPLGFVWMIYFSQVRPLNHPVAITVALGLFISLTIEVSQVFFPTRSSGVTDLITNTAGTTLGVVIYHMEPLKKWSTMAWGSNTSISSAARTECSSSACY